MIIINPKRGTIAIWGISCMNFANALDSAISYMIHGNITLAEMDIERELVKLLAVTGGGAVIGVIIGIFYASLIEKSIERSKNIRIFLRVLEVIILVAINGLTITLFMLLDK